jgi:hypothetical protein
MPTPPIQTTATTLHGQLLEVAIALQTATTFPGNEPKVEIDPDIVTKLIKIQATIPMTVIKESDEIRIKATDLGGG